MNVHFETKHCKRLNNFLRFVFFLLFSTIFWPLLFQPVYAKNQDNACSTKVPNYTVKRLTFTPVFIETNLIPSSEERVFWIGGPGGASAVPPLTEEEKKLSPAERIFLSDGTKTKSINIDGFPSPYGQTLGYLGPQSDGEGEIVWSAKVEHQGQRREDIFYFDGTKTIRLTYPDNDRKNFNPIMDSRGRIAWIRWRNVDNNDPESENFVDGQQIMLYDQGIIKRIDENQVGEIDDSVAFLEDGRLVWVGLKNRITTIFIWADGKLTDFKLGEGGLGISFHMWDKKGGFIYTDCPDCRKEDYSGPRLNRLMYYDLTTQQNTQIAMYEGYIIEDWTIKTSNKNVAWTYLQDNYSKVHLWTNGELREVSVPKNTDWIINSLSPDGSLLLLHGGPLNKPVSLYLYDVHNDKMQLLSEASGNAQFSPYGDIVWQASYINSAGSKSVDICYATYMGEKRFNILPPRTAQCLGEAERDYQNLIQTPLTEYRSIVDKSKKAYQDALKSAQKTAHMNLKSERRSLWRIFNKERALALKHFHTLTEEHREQLEIAKKECVQL